MGKALAEGGAFDSLLGGRWGELDRTRGGRTAKGGQLSYPYIFERRPGELWVVAGFAFAEERWKGPVPLRLRIDEKEFLRKTGFRTKS